MVPDRENADKGADIGKTAAAAEETATETAAEAQTGETGKEPPKKEKKKERKPDERDARIRTLESESAELKDRLLRLMAEYDNFRKRTQKEKEGIYTDAFADAVSAMLPVADNLERAVAFDGEGLKEGLTLTLRQMKDSFGKLGVEEIPAEGETFDPMVHNAVMHEDAPELPENTVSQVLQKGYRIGDKVVRHSMVKVAN